MPNVARMVATICGMNGKQLSIEGELGVTTRKGFASRWGRCARTVTGWLAEGLPHMKFGHRSLVINIAEGDKWVTNRFRVRRIPKRAA